MIRRLPLLCLLLCSPVWAQSITAPWGGKQTTMFPFTAANQILVATDYGMTPNDGTNDLPALVALLAQSTAASPKWIYVPPGVYTMTNAGGTGALYALEGFVGTLQGAGAEATIFDCGGYTGDCITSTGFTLNRYTIRDLGFRSGTTGTPIMLKVKRSDRDVRVQNVNFDLTMGYGIMCDGCSGLRIEGGVAWSDGDIKAGETPRALYLQQTANNVQVDNLRCDYLSDCIYCVGSATTSPVRDLRLNNLDVDGGWWTLKARYTNSGADVTYAPTTLTDASAPFTANGVLVAQVVKAMTVLNTGTVTSMAGGALVDGAVVFDAALKRGDEVRTATAFAIVEQRLSNTSLALTEWRSLTTYRPVSVPPLGTAYTAYGIKLAEAANSANTTSVITVYRWFDSTGATVADPAAGTRYEVGYGNTGYGVKSTINCSNVQIAGGSFKRNGASSIELTGDANAVVDANFRDGKDGAVTVNGIGNVVNNNVCDHMGRFCVSAGGLTTANTTINGNTMFDGRWTSPGNPPSFTGFPITILSADTSTIVGNVIMKGTFVATSTVAYGIYIDDSSAGNDATGNLIGPNIFGTFDTAGIRLADADAAGTIIQGLNTTISDGGAVGTLIQGGTIAQAALASVAAPARGSYIGCSDCTPDADCAPAGGTGGLARFLNAAWACTD